MTNDNGPVVDATELAEQVEQIWQDVLGPGAQRPGVTFFDLQGQSISAIRIITRIEDETGVEVDASLLFDDPDLPGFVAHVLTAAGHRPDDAIAG